MRLETREKEKQRKKQDQASMKCTRVDAKLSNTSPEVLRARIRRDNVPDGPPPLKRPKITNFVTGELGLTIW